LKQTKNGDFEIDIKTLNFIANEKQKQTQTTKQPQGGASKSKKTKSRTASKVHTGIRGGKFILVNGKNKYLKQ
jgi:hypothetical protein